MTETRSAHVITRQIQPSALHDRVVGKTLFLPASLAFLVAMRRRSRRTELWIGDSHAMCANRTITNSMFMRAPEGQIVVRAGARLMHSLAANGFPSRVTRVIGVAARFGRPGAFVPVFSAGEIDIRAHLPDRADAPLDFVDAYVERCIQTAAPLRPRRVGFLVPPPPVDIDPDLIWFPTAGTLEARVAAHGAVRERLRAAVARHRDAVLLDFTDELAGASGAMPVELSLDGGHINDAAMARIRTLVAELRLLED